MSIVSLEPPSPVEPGDLLIRRKHSGLGWHYATGLNNGLVKDVTPGRGKHLTTLDGFLAGREGFIVRPNRTAFEKVLVAQRALSNIGGLYAGLVDNCEHDASFAQTGVATSPTVNAFGAIALLALGSKIAADLMTPDPPARRARRRRTRNS
jgi:hypothetical protein